MSLDYNTINILILFGALQGFTLCLFLYQKRQFNPPSVYFFLVFLFSLAFFNLNYALLDMSLFDYYRPLYMFPLPYKWLIGPGFYFFVKYQFQKKPAVLHHRREAYLFLPALVYASLQSYWFYIAISENSWRIMHQVIDSDFYRINEVAYLVFNLVVAGAALAFIKQHRSQLAKLRSQLPAWRWLRLFGWIFLLKTAADLLLIVIDMSLHAGEESWLFYAITLVLNSAYIYWIGYLGFSRPRLFTNVYQLKTDKKLNTKQRQLKQKLQAAMEVDELYTNPQLSIAELALHLQLPAKELSAFINEVHQQNFSDYLHTYRIEKVKKLLLSAQAEQFTLLSLAEAAGFSSKSSFHAIFKKKVGMTPSAYRKHGKKA